MAILVCRKKNRGRARMRFFKSANYGGWFTTGTCTGIVLTRIRIITSCTKTSWGYATHATGSQQDRNRYATHSQHVCYQNLARYIKFGPAITCVHNLWVAYLLRSCCVRSVPVAYKLIAGIRRESFEHVQHFWTYSACVCDHLRACCVLQTYKTY